MANDAEEYSMLTVKFVKFSDRAQVPTYGREGDACCDLYAADVGSGPIWPGETRVVHTDLGIELPPGYEAQVRPRSGRSRDGLLVHFGTCDENFRGNIGATVTNLGRDPYPLKVGERIAQLAIRPVERAVFVAVEELAPSARSTAGYGSSDK